MHSRFLTRMKSCLKIHFQFKKAILGKQEVLPHQRYVQNSIYKLRTRVLFKTYWCRLQTRGVHTPCPSGPPYRPAPPRGSACLLCPGALWENTTLCNILTFLNLHYNKLTVRCNSYFRINVRGLWSHHCPYRWLWRLYTGSSRGPSVDYIVTVPARPPHSPSSRSTRTQCGCWSGRVPPHRQWSPAPVTGRKLARHGRPTDGYRPAPTSR